MLKKILYKSMRYKNTTHKNDSVSRLGINAYQTRARYKLNFAYNTLMTCYNRKTSPKTQLLFAIRLTQYLILYLTLLFLISRPLAAATLDEYVNNHHHPHISQKLALSLGVKIWQNESSGKFAGLIMWNEGEDFASLGIGHFVWRPRNQGASISDEFPRLLKYLQKRGILLPAWLQSNNIIYCPWQNRREFLLAQNSPQIIELQSLLLHTITLQAEYMVYRLKTILPKLLASTSSYDRPYICQQFYALINTPNGLYAMTDYLNFKGSGTLFAKHYDNYGWGLLQVLEQMRFAPSNVSTIQAFTWSAKIVLTRHVKQASSDDREQYEEWLPGWLKRVSSYE